MNSMELSLMPSHTFPLLYGLIKQHKFIEAAEMITKMDKSGFPTIFNVFPIN